MDVILTNFEETANELKKTSKAKVGKVGNPISTDFFRYSKEQAREKLNIPKEKKTVILSFGGSLG